MTCRNARRGPFEPPHPAFDAPHDEIDGAGQCRQHHDQQSQRQRQRHRLETGQRADSQPAIRPDPGVNVERTQPRFETHHHFAGVETRRLDRIDIRRRRSIETNRHMELLLDARQPASLSLLLFAAQPATQHFGDTTKLHLVETVDPRRQHPTGVRQLVQRAPAIIDGFDHRPVLTQSRPLEVIQRQVIELEQSQRHAQCRRHRRQPVIALRQRLAGDEIGKQCQRAADEIFPVVLLTHLVDDQEAEQYQRKGNDQRRQQRHVESQEGAVGKGTTHVGSRGKCRASSRGRRRPRSPLSLNCLSRTDTLCSVRS